jgi:dynein heavy chain
MTDELDKLMFKILDNQVGDIWHKYAYPSLKPLSAWLINLNKRVEFFEEWISREQLTKYWLPGFFFT